MCLNRSAGLGPVTAVVICSLTFSRLFGNTCAIAPPNTCICVVANKVRRDLPEGRKYGSDDGDKTNAADEVHHILSVSRRLCSVPYSILHFGRKVKVLLDEQYNPRRCKPLIASQE